MFDLFNRYRVECHHEDCNKGGSYDCLEYQLNASESHKCYYCGHFARDHRIDSSVTSCEGSKNVNEADEPPFKKESPDDKTFENKSSPEVASSEGALVLNVAAVIPGITSGPTTSISSPQVDISVTNQGDRCEVSEPHPSTSFDSQTEISNLASRQQEVLFIPAAFSPRLAAFLGGKDANLFKVKPKKMLDQLIRELTLHLDDNGLITSSNAHQNRADYGTLSRQLTSKFGFVDFTECKKRGIESFASVVSLISSRRRQMRHYLKSGKGKKCNKIKKQLDPNEALAKLEALLIGEMNENEVIHLLKVSFPIRRDRIEKMPQYLLLKGPLLYEISQRIGLSLDTIQLRLQAMLDDFKQATSNQGASFEDVEKYFKSNSSNQARCLEIKKDIPTKNVTELFGPCVVLVEEENDLYISGWQEKRFLLVSGHIDIMEATVIMFGLYYIYMLDYPNVYSQFLGFLEIYMDVSKNPFPMVLRGQKLIQLLQKCRALREKKV